jgi:hypothetical protein
MDNPENWQHRSHETEKKSKQKHNTICIGHHHTQTQTNTNNVNKTNRTSFLCGNRNGHHNIKTYNNATQKTKKMSSMDPTKKPWVNSDVREGEAVPASYKTPSVLFIYTVKSGKSLGSYRGKKKST